MSAPEPRSLTYPLKHIYFYLTEGCNLRCRHCWIVPEEDSSPKGNALLELELFESILEQARPLGLAGVKLTGGEPFLHPQVHRMLEIIREADYRLVVETNGVLVTPELAAQVADCRQPFVSVSLDGAESTTHEWVRRVPGCFEAALEGVKHLVQVGLKPQIIFTIMRRNRDQVEDVVRLTQNLGAGSVKFNIIQGSPRSDRMHDEGETLSLPELVELGRWVERELIPRVDIPLLFHHPPAFRPLSRMFADNGLGCGICGILGIIGVLADGSYSLCGIGESIPALIFGHASQDSLTEVWQGHPVLREIREGLPHRLGGICHDCLLKGRCLGSCLAQNYYRAQDLWTPFWFCDEAEKAGLFPVTRKRPSIGETSAGGSG